MKRPMLVLGLTLAAGVTIGVVSDRSLMAQQSPVTRTMLQQKDIEGMDSRETIVYLAEFVPGGVAGRHYHPGPEVGYVLEGSLVLEPDGHTPMTLKAGDSFHNPSKHIHNVRNASATERVKVLVFLIGEKGQPLATPVQ